jgi:ELWxxDGT repeat protein
MSPTSSCDVVIKLSNPTGGNIVKKTWLLGILSLLGVVTFLAGCTSNSPSNTELQFAAVGPVQVGSVAYPEELTAIGDTLYFSAGDFNSSTINYELWKSDGTDVGTVLVKEIRPGNTGSSPEGLVDVNGILFFRANDGVNGVELWKSDGTTAGTVMVKNINPSGDSYPYGFLNVNGMVYFSANDGVKGNELWKTDGTAAGTVLVRDINTGVASSNAGGFTNINGTIYFRALKANSGRELWKTDGTTTGTRIVKNINPSGDSNPNNLVNFGDTLFFQADDGVNGVELWKSDGTGVGTTLVKDINPGSGFSSPLSSFKIFQNTLFFSATDGDFVNVAGGYRTNSEVWKTDGTAAGTVLVKDINTTSTLGSHPTFFEATPTTLLFSADDGITGNELWKTDGTAVGTKRVKNINSGKNSSNTFVGGPLYFNNTLYFQADTATYGRELWKSNGTGAGTSLVSDIFPGSSGSRPGDFTNVDGTIFFATGVGAGLFGTPTLWKYIP